MTARTPKTPVTPYREEPAQNAEEDLPSDGKDIEGEKLIDDLGRQHNEPPRPKPVTP